MKFATFQDGTRDGQLLLVSTDLRSAVSLAPLASSLQEALERWDALEGEFRALSETLNAGRLPQARPFEAWHARSPMPCAPQWCEAAAFLNFAHVLDKASNVAPRLSFDTAPAMHRGASDYFHGPCEDLPFADDAQGIDFEGGFAVVVADVQMGCSAHHALSRIRLVMQNNSWVLRGLAQLEASAFSGPLQARPATSFAPVAVTPDELGSTWHAGRVHLALHVAWNGQRFGKPHGAEMDFSFGELVAHAARTRGLSAGSIVGSGVVSNAARGLGTACIAERRLLEMLDQGMVRTGFMQFGDRVRMVARDPNPVIGAPFGAIDQRVVKAP